MSTILKTYCDGDNCETEKKTTNHWFHVSILVEVDKNAIPIGDTHLLIGHLDVIGDPDIHDRRIRLVDSADYCGEACLAKGIQRWLRCGALGQRVKTREEE